ncbi:terpene synthase-like isoform X1 [Leptidea sinapis]|uniref:terpene synthase-like isoform X1 n=1 Tax=Leptidea sinapis TaxID=189913 RepID=UPI0021C31FE5|nr:terpene synthase-like isoform X1 [Leptidea sinapis]
MSFLNSKSGDDMEEKILLPYTHIKKLPTKEWRRNMKTSFNYWLRVPQDKMEEVVDITEMFYVCTVIEDDILDGTKLRRGVPTAHSTFGLPLTVNSIAHLLLLVLQRCTQLHPKAALIFSEEGLELFRGQGAEVYTRDNFICPTEEDYMTTQAKKLRGIFNLCFRLMQLFSDDKTDYSDFVVKLSMYFQMRGDYCNICNSKALQECSPSTNQNSGDFYDDLTEGKFTLPIIHATKTSKRDAILNILKQKTNDFTLKQYCVSLLEQAGSLQYTRDVLTKLDSELRDEIKKFGGNPPLEAVLDDLLSWRDT